MADVVHPGLTPRQIVEARVDAFRRGDFGAIYDSYHPRASFLEQFPEREAYLDYARQHIADSCSIETCRILHEVVDGQEARVIFQQLIKLAAGFQESFEMAFFVEEAGAWLYMGSDRIERGDFIGRPEDLRPDDFTAVTNRVFF